MSTAEKFFQGLRDDRRDRAAGRAGVIPDRCGQPDGKPDREHRALVRDRDPAARGGQGDVTAGLPLRAAQPPGQQPRRLGSRGAGIQQAGGLVDVLRVLRGTRAAIPRHDMKLLQIMSDSRRKPSACPAPAHRGCPAARDRAIHDATVTSVEVSSSVNHRATRRSQAPISTPSSTPARTAARSSRGANPPGSASSGPAGTGRSPAKLQPPVTQRDLEAEVAFCVGGVISPLLANLFMHYAFDTWMDREFPGCPFERYADDIVAHCDSREQAASYGLPSPGGSGPWDWSCIPGRRRSCTARTRTAGGTSGTPASISSATPSGAAWPRGEGAISLASPGYQRHGEEGERPEIRDWHLNRRSSADLSGLAREINPQVQGWINYYGAFYRSELCLLAWRINEHLARWAMHKFKRFRGKYAKAMAWLQKVYQYKPGLFAHWQLIAFT